MSDTAEPPEVQYPRRLAMRVFPNAAYFASVYSIVSRKLVLCAANPPGRLCRVGLSHFVRPTAGRRSRRCPSVLVVVPHPPARPVVMPRCQGRR